MNESGAEHRCIASLIETAKFQGVELQIWLADILTKLVNLWPNSGLDELLPWNWGAERQATLA